MLKAIRSTAYWTGLTLPKKRKPKTGLTRLLKRTHAKVDRSLDRHFERVNAKKITKNLFSGDLDEIKRGRPPRQGV